MAALREIKKCQEETRTYITRAGLSRVVRELMANLRPGAAALRITANALLCIHEAVEEYAVNLFADTVLCSIHAKRVTVNVADIQLARRVRGLSEAYYG